MKDLLENYVSHLKYGEAIKIEQASKETRNAKKEKTKHGKNIVRVISDIRKDLDAITIYKKETKDYFFSHPIYQLFPCKNTTIRKAEHISYVSKETNEEDIAICLKKIDDVIMHMYSDDSICKAIPFSDDLLCLFMEVCRQVTVLNFDIGSLLKQVFNYKLYLLNQYHKLYKSSITFNIKKKLKQREILTRFKNEIEKKKKNINTLKTEIINVEEIIEKETLSAEKELSEINIIYQNKIDKLKKKNQRKMEEFTRILQLHK